MILLVAFRVLSTEASSSVTQDEMNDEETCKQQTYASLKALLQFYQESEVITWALQSVFYMQDDPAHLESRRCAASGLLLIWLVNHISPDLSLSVTQTCGVPGGQSVGLWRGYSEGLACIHISTPARYLPQLR